MPRRPSFIAVQCGPPDARELIQPFGSPRLGFGVLPIETTNAANLEPGILGFIIISIHGIKTIGKNTELPKINRNYVATIIRSTAGAATAPT
jgi:hypothetical protein